MQLKLSPQVFPLVFHCANCNKVMAMIEQRPNEDSFRLVTFAHGNADARDMQTTVDKGTLVECLLVLSTMAYEHTLVSTTVRLLGELEEIFQDDDSFPVMTLDGEETSPESEIEYFPENDNTATRH